MLRAQIKGLEVGDECVFIRRYKAKKGRKNLRCGRPEYIVDALAAALCDPH